MALYTLKSEDEVMNQANNSGVSNGLLAMNPHLQLFNSIGRTTGSGSDDNFFTKKGKSIENALGTTVASLIGARDVDIENQNIEKRQKQAKQSMEDIVKKHGYNSQDEFWDASNAAEKEIFSKYGFDSDAYWDKHAELWSPANKDSKEVKDLEATRQDVINRMSQEDADRIKKFENIENELKGQSQKNVDIANKASEDWKNYRENSYVGQKTNQDRGKFLGSAINTLSTASDIMLPGAGVAFNAVQGGIEGIADELEQNGLENFDWGRAGQNALTGAVTGLATGAVNKGMSNALAKRGGNLLKGGNKLTAGLNKFNANNPVGQLASTLGTGAARGAVSGAVGGATGAGLQSALAGQNIGQGVANALQGAVQGAQQGATTGAIMTGANMVANKTPGVGDMLQKFNQAGEDWNARKAEGQSFGQRLGETWDESTTKRVSDKIGQELGKSWDATKQGFKNVGEGLAILNERGLLPSPGMIVKDVSGDGMLNLEKGDVMPLQAKQKTLSELSNGEYKTIGDMLKDGLELKDLKAVLPKKDYETLLANARDIADNNNPIEQMNVLGVDSKSELPILNRQQYYEDTIGPLRNKDGSKNKYVSAKDVPDYMRNRLSNNTGRSNDDILGEFFGNYDKDNRYDLDQMYEMYEKMAEGSNANEIYTPENIDNGIEMAGKKGERITNRVANKLLGGERNIEIQGRPGRNQNINVTNDSASWESNTPTRQDEAVLNMMASVPEEMRLPQDIRNMRINDGTQLPPETGGAGNAGGIPPRNPATELYNSLNRQPEEPIDLTDAFGDKGLGTIQQRNKLQSLGQQLQNSAKTQKFGPVFDSLDVGTARRAVETQAPQRLADLGIQPQDYTEAAKVSSYVNRVVSDLADKSKVKVNVPGLADQLSASSLTLPFGSDSNRKTYEQAIRNLTTADGDSPSQYTVSKLIETSRKLGQKAFDAKGNTDSAKELRNAYSEAKHAMRDIASEALTQSGITGDATTEMIAKGLKDLGANQATIDYICAPENGKAPSAKELIRRTSLFEQARDMGEQIEAEKYTRSASKAPANPMTRIWRASGLDQPIETILRNTVAPVASGLTNAAGKAIEGVGNAMAGVKGNSGGDAATTTTSEITINPSYNPQTRLFDAIGRTEGAITRDNARNGAYLAEAAQEAEVVPNTMMQTASIPTTDSSTALYNSVTGIAPAQTATTASTQGAMPSYGSQSAEQAIYFFPPTGDYWSDMLSQAMRSAKNAGDYDALGQLYEMYQTQVSKLEKQAQSASTSTKSTKLTDTQRRANAAMNSLDRISTMTPDLGYNLSGIPVIGDIATWGGNDYESEAKSLAQQIGYMLSGANIKEEEAYNIGKAYVPQPFDSEQTRKNKLQRAYDIIQQYQNGYAE